MCTTTYHGKPIVCRYTCISSDEIVLVLTIRCLIFFSPPRCPVGRREHSDRRTCRDELQCCCDQCCYRGCLSWRRHDRAGHRLGHPEHEHGLRRGDGGCRYGRAKHRRSAPVRCGCRLPQLKGIWCSAAVRVYSIYIIPSARGTFKCLGTLAPW